MAGAVSAEYAAIRKMVGRVIKRAAPAVLDLVEQKVRASIKRRLTPSQSSKSSRPFKAPRKAKPPKFRSAKSALRGSRPLHVTRGYHGVFKSRRRVPPTTKMLNYGSLKKREIGGGAVSDFPGTEQRVLYIGHSTMNRTEIYATMTRALARKLVMMAKVDFTAWTDPLPVGTGGWFVTVRSFDNLGDTAPGSTVSASLGVANDFQDLANTIGTTITSRFGGANESTTPEFVFISLSTEDPGATDSRQVAVINLKNLYLNFYITSKMTIQNRTKSSNVVDDPSAENRNDIENNPLNGYRYMYTGNSAYMRGTNYTRETNLFVPDVTNGYINFVPNSDDQRSRFHRPPLPQMIRNCKKYGRLRIMPGEMKSSYLKYDKRMQFQAFIRLFKDQIFQIQAVSNDPVRCGMGNCEVMALEKSLDSREATEPAVTVGWEISQTYGCYCTYKPSNATVQIMEVSGVAVPQ